MNLVQTFRSNSSHSNFFKILANDAHSILVGGQNHVFNLSASDLSENQAQVRKLDHILHSPPMTVSNPLLARKMVGRTVDDGRPRLSGSHRGARLFKGSLESLRQTT
eukprot:TCALIF_09247-PA protein Name:"Protein of unknown function" AED:0.75 eAED:0.75 QI:0/0/0/0.5/1/1/2/0/106